MKHIKNINEFIGEQQYHDASEIEDMLYSYGNDMELLSVLWKVSVDSLEDLLKKAEDRLSWLKKNPIKGVTAIFYRRDMDILKSKINLIKDVIKHKRRDPDFVPDWVK